MKITRGELKKFINEELSILLSEETDFTKLGYTATDDEIKAAYNALTDKEKAKVDDPNAMYDRTAMIRSAHQRRTRHGAGSKEAPPTSAGPIDYKGYDELTDDQRKRVDQSVNTEIRALDMEGIEASDRAKARWREKYTKHVQNDDAKKAATDASISQKKDSASAGEAKEDEWMKILKDKYIDVEVMGLPRHGSEYEGKPLPGGKLAIKMVSDVAKELADAGTPVPEEFIQTQRARLVPRDLGHKQGPEIGSAEEKRATAALKLKNFMRSNQGRTPEEVEKRDEDYRWRQKNDPNFFQGAAGQRAIEKRAKEMADEYGGGWGRYADMSEPQRRAYAKRMDAYESEQEANGRRDRENERAKRLAGKPAVGSKMNMDTFGGAKFESKKGNTNMKVTKRQLKQIIKEELEAALDEYMTPVNRPANQKKPWGGRTSHQDKPLRWGGSDIAPASQGSDGTEPTYKNLAKDAEWWSQAVYEAEYLDQKAFANWDARNVAAAIRRNGVEELPEELRLSWAVQNKYEYYYGRDTGERPACYGTGKCGPNGQIV